MQLYLYVVFKSLVEGHTPVVLSLSGNAKDWRRMPTTGDALDCPDDSLASLSQLNTLMSFGWNNPMVPETTLILQNDLPLDEQLIASLPETSGIQYRVKKTTSAAPELEVTKSKTGNEIRLNEIPQQVCMLRLYYCCTICHISDFVIKIFITLCPNSDDTKIQIHLNTGTE